LTVVLTPPTIAPPAALNSPTAITAPFLPEAPKVAAPPVIGWIPPRLTICSVTLVAVPQPVTPATSTVRTSKNAMFRFIMVPPGYRFVVCGYRGFTESPVVASPPSTNANRPCRGDFCKAGFVRYVGAVRHVRWVSCARRRCGRSPAENRRTEDMKRGHSERVRWFDCHGEQYCTYNHKRLVHAEGKSQHAELGGSNCRPGSFGEPFLVEQVCHLFVNRL